jgi:hypothetical protein
MVFSLCILTIAHIFVLLAAPVAHLFTKPLDQSLWPTSLEYVGDELWTMVPPVFVCLIISVTFLVPREAQLPARSNPSLIADLVGFFRSGISIFIACIGVSLLIKFAQLFYEYGSFHLPNDALSSMRLVLPVIQSFIPVAVCLFTTWYIASRSDSTPRRHPSFVGTLLAIAGTVGFLAVLYDLTFLSEYLRVRPQDGPGWEHLLFSVVANVVISVSAFVSLVLFFRGRSILQDPAVKCEQQGVPAMRSAPSLVPDFNRPKDLLRTHDQHTPEIEPARRSVRRRRTHGYSAENGQAIGASLSLGVGAGRVEPA